VVIRARGAGLAGLAMAPLLDAVPRVVHPVSSAAGKDVATRRLPIPTRALALVIRRLL